jgi:hypothetical protein
MKTNREKNQDYDVRAQARVRPAAKFYNFEPLQSVLENWRPDPAVKQVGNSTYE